MSYKIEIADSTSHKIEISSSINDQTPIIQILEGHSSDINISHDIALLPADFNENVKTIIDSFLTAGYGVSIVPSGSFLRISTSGLQPSGNYSLVGHSHVSSDITNFNSSVSGLLPVKNVVSGSGIAVSDINGTFTVAVTGQFGLTSEQVDDRVSSLLSSGYGINLNYDDNNNLLTISTIGLQPSGNYSVVGHSHVSSDITDFILVASGASPVQSVAGRLGHVALTKNDVGLSNVDNTSDINKPVSTAQATADSVIQSIAASDATLKANNAQAYAVQRSNHTGTQTASTISDFIAVASGAAPVQTVAGRVGNVILNKNDVGLNSVDNTSDINKPVSAATQNALNLKSDIGHVHTSSNITDFSSTVSGLLPVKNILSGSGISVTSVGSDFTVAVTGQFGLTGEQVDDRVSNLLVAGNYVNLSYNDPNDSLMISVTGVQPSGSYAEANHNHVSSQITDFNTSVSGLLPVVNISAGSNIVISNAGGNFIVGSTGLQPSGNYSVAGHSHLSSDITNFNTSVSGLLTPYATINSPSFSGTPTAPTASSGTNNFQIANTQFVRTEISNLVNSAPSTLDTLNELATALGNDPNFATTITNNLAGKANLTGATFSGPISGPSGDFGVLKQSGVVVSVSGHTHSYTDITNFASGVSDNLTTALLAGSFINLDYNSSQDTLTISASGLQPSGNYSLVGHTHTSSDITDFNSSVSGLLPVKNVLGSGYITSSSSSGVVTIAVTGLQPSGNYSTVGHTHASSSITDFNSSVSGLLPVKNVVASSGIDISSVSGIYTISSPEEVVEYLTAVQFPSSGNTSLLYIATDDSRVYRWTGSQYVEIGPTAFVPLSSGNFSTLQVNGTDVSLSGHTHTASNITDFNSSVSGLLPVTNILGGSNITISQSGTNFTVAVTGSLGLTTEEVDDRVAALLVAGIGIAIDYNDPANTLTINTSGLQPSGNYALAGHTHTSSNITDFNSSVSGLINVKDIISGPNIDITNNNGLFTISSNVSNNLTRGSFLLNETADTFNVVNGYNVGSLDIFLNGVKLSSNGDYIASNGTSFTLTSPAPSGSVIEYLAMIPGHNFTGTDLLVFNNSPTFTGIPIVPTAAGGTNTNQIASTSFVRTEINNIQASNISDFNSSVSGLLPTHNNIIIHSNISDINALNISGVNYIYIFNSGAENSSLILPTALNNQNTYTLKNNTNGNIYYKTSNSQTIDSYSPSPMPSGTVIGLNIKYSSITVVSDGNNWIIT